MDKLEALVELYRKKKREQKRREISGAKA